LGFSGPGNQHAASDQRTAKSPWSMFCFPFNLLPSCRLECDICAEIPKFSLIKFYTPTHVEHARVSKCDPQSEVVLGWACHIPESRWCRWGWNFIKSTHWLLKPQLRVSARVCVGVVSAPWCGCTRSNTLWLPHTGIRHQTTPNQPKTCINDSLIETFKFASFFVVLQSESTNKTGKFKINTPIRRYYICGRAVGMHTDDQIEWGF